MTKTPEYIDLHIHSTYSDGVLTPSEVAERAASLNIKTISIADHDSVGGIEEAIHAASRLVIDVIPAVELSVEYREWKDVHLLGYAIDFQNKRFLQQLDTFRQQREKRNEAIVERVNRALMGEGKQTISLSKVREYAKDAIGRPHIARALLDKNYVSSVEDAFRRYLKPCNVPKIYWQISDAIRVIKQIGGFAVLAHPTSITQDLGLLESIIRELISLGLDGIEVHNNFAQLDEQERLRRLAIKLSIITTAGSDFHGIEEGIEMGKGRGGVLFKPQLLTPLKNAMQLK